MNALVVAGAVAALAALGVFIGGIGFLWAHDWWRTHGREEHQVHALRREIERNQRKKVIL